MLASSPAYGPGPRTVRSLFPAGRAVAKIAHGPQTLSFWRRPSSPVWELSKDQQVRRDRFFASHLLHEESYRYRSIIKALVTNCPGPAGLHRTHVRKGTLFTGANHPANQAQGIIWQYYRPDHRRNGYKNEKTTLGEVAHMRPALIKPKLIFSREAQPKLQTPSLLNECWLGIDICGQSVRALG